MPTFSQHGPANLFGVRFSRLALLAALTFALAPASPAAAQGKNKIRLPESVRTIQKIEMDVAPVDDSRRDEVIAKAEEIDRLVEKVLREKGITPNPLADDHVFLRRVFLDVAGRIPTLEETTAFFASDEATRRREVIDLLLESPDYVFNFYNFWADVLRLTERPQGNIIADPYLAYVKDSIRENKPYDQWVYEMLTAEGRVWENPAVGFQLRDEGQPLPYLDNTVRVFLGTQIGCAQCHDHPFDNWTQYQFYQLAAYTSGTKTRMDGRDPEFKNGNVAGELIRDGLAQAREKDPMGRLPGEFYRIVRANTYRVSEIERPLRLPHDYAYPDHEPKSVVEPAVLWGEVPSEATGKPLRHQFAAWLTSADNEYFSRTVANRLWKRLTGVGIVEPVDDFNPDHAPTNPELLDFLADEMVRLEFNQKEFMRTILYSKTYQRESTPYEVTSGEPYYFPGPALRRMTAEQAWDSILTLAVYNPVPFQRPTAEEMAPVIDLDFTTATVASVHQAAARFAQTYYMGPYKRSLNEHAYKGAVLCRASELPQPLPGDHFLRQFGLGDRESISGGQTVATVPQILTIFNGPITHVMLETGSRIYDNVDRVAGNPRMATDVIFLSILTRRPTASDRRIAITEVTTAKTPAIGYGNVIWALLNTREFLFVQ